MKLLFSKDAEHLSKKPLNGTWNWPPRTICSFVVLGFFLSLGPLCFGILQNANEKKWMARAVHPSVIHHFQSTWAEKKWPESLNAGTALPIFFLITGSSDSHRHMCNLSLYPTFVIYCSQGLSWLCPLHPQCLRHFPCKDWVVSQMRVIQPGVAKRSYSCGELSRGTDWRLSENSKPCPMPWGWLPFCRSSIL